MDQVLQRAQHRFRLVAHRQGRSVGEFRVLQRLVHGALDIVGNGHEVRFRLLVDRHAQGVFAVEPALVRLVLGDVLDLGDVRDGETGTDGQVEDVLEAFEPAERADLGFESRELDAARRQVEVLLGQAALHVEHVESVGFESAGVQGDAHVLLGGAEEEHRVHPRYTFQRHPHPRIEETPDVFGVEIGCRDDERKNGRVVLAPPAEPDMADVAR